MEFLGFRLYGPLASFGDVAVGQQRPTLAAPTRTVVLGIVASCLGLRRVDADALGILDASLGVATRTDAPGALLVDFHTAQAPDRVRVDAFARRRGSPPATRRDEVSCTTTRDGSPATLDTLLSWRQYRTDAAYASCIWLRPTGGPPRWSLGEIGRFLQRPVFAPFLGRKSAVLALPFEPQMIEAAHPVEALRGLRFSLDSVIARHLDGEAGRVYRYEGLWPEAPVDRTEERRDQVASRARWQFTPRAEHVWTEIRGESAPCT